LGLGFSVGDITVGACFCVFDQLYLALGANPTKHFWLKIFVETRRSSASSEPLNDLLAYLDPKLWLKTPFFTKIKKCRKSVICPLTVNLAGHNSAAAYARELFKPSKARMANLWRFGCLEVAHCILLMTTK